jgi:hypothetical protein
MNRKCAPVWFGRVLDRIRDIGLKGFAVTQTTDEDYLAAATDLC